MIRERLPRFHFLLTEGISLLLETNSKEAARLIHKFLFPIRLRRPEPVTLKAKLISKLKNEPVTLLFSKKISFRCPDILSAFPLLDREVRRKILARLPQHFFPIHCAAFLKGKEAFLLLGESTAGKSRALLELLRLRFSGLSDELNFLNLKTLHVHPYYRTFVLKAPSPQSFLRLTHVKLKQENYPGDPAFYLPAHYYFARQAGRHSFPRRPCFLKTIFHLKSRTARRNAVRKVKSAEWFKWLADNIYLFAWRKGENLSQARKYDRLLLQLFQTMGRLQETVRGFELQVRAGASFSHLITRKGVMRSSSAL